MQTFLWLKLNSVVFSSERTPMSFPELLLLEYDIEFNLAHDIMITSASGPWYPSTVLSLKLEFESIEFLRFWSVYLLLLQRLISSAQDIKRLMLVLRIFHVYCHFSKHLYKMLDHYGAEPNLHSLLLQQIMIVFHHHFFLACSHIIGSLQRQIFLDGV